MNYDYAAMDAAFEEMMHIGQKIESDVDGLMDDVERMFQNSEGALMEATSPAPAPSRKTSTPRTSS